jgi:hypothetical protein
MPAVERMPDPQRPIDKWAIKVSFDSQDLTKLKLL